jgi:hypothetical protein
MLSFPWPFHRGLSGIRLMLVRPWVSDWTGSVVEAWSKTVEEMTAHGIEPPGLTEVERMAVGDARPTVITPPLRP